MKKIKIKFINFLLRIGFSRKSYSQCGEDLIIEYLIRSLGIKDISWIDIGAHHPKYLNNTYLFYKKGFRGINIDASPRAIAKFKLSRGSDTNINCGIASENKTMQFYVLSDPALSCFGEVEVNKTLGVNNKISLKNIRDVECITLSSLVKKVGLKSFPTLLSIDIEGMDELIIDQLYGFPANILPKIICCETINYENFENQTKNHNLINKIENLGYRVYGDTWLNTIFVRT